LKEKGKSAEREALVESVSKVWPLPAGEQDRNGDEKRLVQKKAGKGLLASARPGGNAVQGKRTSKASTWLGTGDLEIGEIAKEKIVSRKRPRGRQR